jgi:hypothetical protein
MTKRELERSITGCYQEIDLSIRYLLVKQEPLHSEQWSELWRFMKATELARQRFNEDELELAAQALPPF